MIDKQISIGSVKFTVLVCGDLAAALFEDQVNWLPLPMLMSCG